MTGAQGYAAYRAPYSGDPSKAGVSKQNRLGRSLWSVVAVLGPMSYAVSLGSPQLPLYPARLGVFAAIVAAIGLLPGQRMRGWIIVALAVVGFLDALAPCVRLGVSDWPLTSVVFLNAIQSIAAVVALLLESRTFASAEFTGRQEHSSYSRLVEAYQAYALQYQQYCQTSASASTAQGQAEAQAHVGATARAPHAQVDTAQESFAALQARYIRQGIGAPTQQSRGPSGEVPTGRIADIGVADRKHTVPESYPYPGGRPSAEQNISEATGP